MLDTLLIPTSTGFWKEECFTLSNCTSIKRKIITEEKCKATLFKNNEMHKKQSQQRDESVQHGMNTATFDSASPQKQTCAYRGYSQHEGAPVTDLKDTRSESGGYPQCVLFYFCKVKTC